MGRTVCEAVEADSELDLVAAVDVGNDFAGLQRAGAEVVVDFTVASAARDNLPRLAAAGIHAVIGTTGLNDADVGLLRTLFTTSNAVLAWLVKSRLADPTTVDEVGPGGGLVRPGRRLVWRNGVVTVAALVLNVGWITYQIGLPSGV